MGVFDIFWYYLNFFQLSVYSIFKTVFKHFGAIFNVIRSGKTLVKVKNCGKISQKKLLSRQTTVKL